MNRKISFAVVVSAICLAMAVTYLLTKIGY